MNERKAAFTRSKRDCLKPFEMKKNILKKGKNRKKDRKCGDEGEKAESDPVNIGFVTAFEHLQRQSSHCVTKACEMNVRMR